MLGSTAGSVTERVWSVLSAWTGLPAYATLLVGLNNFINLLNNTRGRGGGGGTCTDIKTRALTDITTILVQVGVSWASLTLSV